MNLDMVQAMFQLGGCLAAFNNVRMTYKAKHVEGVSVLSTVWFTSWGVFNLFYFSALNQPLSFWSGAVMVALNAAWVLLMLRYRATTISSTTTTVRT